MKNNKSFRTDMVGKNAYEKEAYKNFLRSKPQLDKTEEKKEDLGRTNSSSFEQDEIDNKKLSKKSWWLQIKDGDYLRSALFIGIAVTLFTAVILGTIKILVTQGVQEEKILNIDGKIKDISSKQTEVDKKINSFETTIAVIKNQIETFIGIKTLPKDVNN